MEKHLLWHSHILSVKSSISKQCGILYLIRNSIDQRSLILIYYTLIYPTLTYCLSLWGGASNEALNCLVTIQKRVIRIIAGLRRRDHTHDTFTSLNILKFTDIISLTNDTFVFKVLNGLSDCENYFAPHSDNPNRTVSTRNNTHLTLPKVNSSQSQTHIRYRGAKTYNKLPIEIREKRSLQSFKKAVKKKLLSSYTVN